jgi:hypothetical protein
MVDLVSNMDPSIVTGGDVKRLSIRPVSNASLGDCTEILSAMRGAQTFFACLFMSNHILILGFCTSFWAF